LHYEGNGLHKHKLFDFPNGARSRYSKPYWDSYFMNTGQIVKSKTAGQFVTLTNDIARSGILSLKAKGLLVHLLSLPTDWVLYKANLYNSINEKKGTIDSAFRELQLKGFVISVKVVDNLGRFVGWNHVVYDQPAEIGETRHSENPTIGKSEIGESAPIQRNISTKKDNIQINNKDKELVFFSSDWEDLWNVWIQYKKEEHRDKFKSKNTEQVALNHLMKISNNDIDIAKEIVNYSIANKYKGLFELKQKINKTSNDKHKQFTDYFKDMVREIDGKNISFETITEVKRIGNNTDY